MIKLQFLILLVITARYARDAEVAKRKYISFSVERTEKEKFSNRIKGIPNLVI